MSDDTRFQLAILEERVTAAERSLRLLTSAISLCKFDSLRGLPDQRHRDEVAMHLLDLRKAAGEFDGKAEVLERVESANADHARPRWFLLRKYMTATAWILGVADSLGRLDPGRLIDAAVKEFDPPENLPADIADMMPTMGRLIESLDDTLSRQDGESEREILRAKRLLFRRSPTASPRRKHKPKRVAESLTAESPSVKPTSQITGDVRATDPRRDRLLMQFRDKMLAVMELLWTADGATPVLTFDKLAHCWTKTPNDDTIRKCVNRVEDRLGECSGIINARLDRNGDRVRLILPD